jgi:hypothetical protein
MDWIYLAQDKEQWKFLFTYGFSKRIHLHRVRFEFKCASESMNVSSVPQARTS